MIQLNPVFVREAARLVADLVQRAGEGEGFALVLAGQGQDSPGRAAPCRPQPEPATGFPVHALLPEGPEGAALPLARAAYTASLAGRLVIEGPVLPRCVSV